MKKRSIKKVLALCLAGAILSGMLTACGGANGSSSAPSASSEGQAEPAAPETEKEKVVLVIESLPWEEAECQQLLSRLKSCLSPYEVPKNIYFQEHLTETYSGKIVRKIK